MKITSSWIILFGFFSRLLLACLNGFLGPTIGADADALQFHEAASHIALSGIYEEFKIGTAPYVNALAVLYKLTDISVFIGSLASCLIWLVSAYFFRKTLLLASAKTTQIRKAALVYAFLPSSLFFTSVTLREAYQLFFVNLAVFSVCKLYFHKRHLYILLLFASVCGFGLLHGALMAFGLVMLSSAFAFIYIPSVKKLSIAKLGLFVVFSIAILLFCFSMFSDVTYDLGGGISQAVSSYQEGGLTVDARAMYKNDAANIGLLFYFFSIPIGFVQYLLEPMPWRNLKAIDVFIIIENCMRIFIIYKACRCFSDLNRSNKELLFLFLYLYVALEFIWSLGTINWGTAVRHHVPAIGLMLLASYSFGDPGSKKKYFYNKKYF